MIFFITENITHELLSAYPNAVRGSSFSGTLLNAIEAGSPKFIMIIDEWDAPLREMPETVHDYLAFLRTLFQGGDITANIFAAAYMTGILPIKRDNVLSAVPGFCEYTVISPDSTAGYLGFTANEVQRLCRECGLDFSEAKEWYAGYSLDGVTIYNPYSVIRALKRRKCSAYWRETAAIDNLLTYVSRDFAGLASDIARLAAGEEIPADVSRFQNDIHVINSRDEVLALLIHLGYLTYDSAAGVAYIPNKELRAEFACLLKNPRYHPGR